MKRLLAGLLLAFVSVAFADVQPITPVYQGSKTISCASSSAATALPSTIAQQRANLELQNAGSAVIFVEFGSSTIEAATTTGYPILVGQSKVVTVPPTTTHIACIVAASTHTLYVTVGTGN